MSFSRSTAVWAGLIVASAAHLARAQEPELRIEIARAPVAAPAAAEVMPAGAEWVGAVRWPAESHCSGGSFFCATPVGPDGLAYFRDVATGARLWVFGGTDGERWGASAVSPSGTIFTWPDVVWYANWNGRTNCFVGGSVFLCNSTSALLDFLVVSQCAATGQWSVSAIDNGAEIGRTTYVVKPTLPPGTTPAWNQGLWTATYYDSTSVPISKKGCALVSYAEMMNYHGVRPGPEVSDPVRDLNRWLIINGGFLLGDIDPLRLPRYARCVNRGTGCTPVEISYRGPSSGAKLIEDICRYGPQPVRPTSDRLPNGDHAVTHWAPATGYTFDDRTELLLADPNGGVLDRHYSYYSTWPNFTPIPAAPTRVFSGPESVIAESSGMFIALHSPVHLVVTDPAGRRTGFDVASGQELNEIPNALYAVAAYDDIDQNTPDPDSPKTFEMTQPPAGDYMLSLTGLDDGTYSLGVRTYDVAGSDATTTFADVAIQAGEHQAYTLTYSPDAGAASVICGGFYGGGQRPRDVNRLLSYVKPTDSRTVLPSGTASYPLRVVYAASVLPATFTAHLNGVDVAPRFTPAAATTETVDLPLQPGTNVLKLSIDGVVGSRTATDTDRLVFDVQ